MDGCPVCPYLVTRHNAFEVPFGCWGISGGFPFLAENNTTVWKDHSSCPHLLLMDAWAVARFCCGHSKISKVPLSGVTDVAEKHSRPRSKLSARWEGI